MFQVTLHDSDRDTLRNTRELLLNLGYENTAYKIANLLDKIEEQIR